MKHVSAKIAHASQKGERNGKGQTNTCTTGKVIAERLSRLLHSELAR